MSADPRHPDIPGFVAGLSAPEDAAAIAAHLGGCTECRSEAAALRSMRRSLRGEWAAHVCIEDLVAHDEGDPDRDPESRDVIEDHLARCRDCRADLEALAGARRTRDAAAVGLRPVTRAAPPAAGARRWSWAWTAASAALMLLGGTVLVTTPWRGSEGRPIPGPRRSITFMPPKRSGLLDRRLVAGDRVSLRVVLPFGTPGGPYRARLEREDGTIVDRPETTSIDAETLSIDLDAPAEPGAYRLVLAIEGRPEGENPVYPFQVLASSSAPGGG
jgi:anti-sigma factor RsiW